MGDIISSCEYFVINLLNIVLIIAALFVIVIFSLFVG